MAVSRLTVRGWLRDGADGTRTLGDVATLLAPLVMGDREAEPGAVELAYAAELRLAELTSGHWTEEEARRLLSELAAL